LLDDYMSMGDILASISLLKAIYDRGVEDTVAEYNDSEFMYDYMSDLYCHGIDTAARRLISDFDAYGTEYFYFFDSAMSYYYRLASKLCKLKGIPQDESPYAKAAWKFARIDENRACYNIDMDLYTDEQYHGANHIRVIVHPEFEQRLELAEHIIHIFSFYRKKLVEMKTEYLALTAPPAELGVAA